MPALRIIYDVDGWAFHNRALALRKHAPPDFEVLIAPLERADAAAGALGDVPVDVVFALPRSKAAAIRREMNRRRWPSKLVTSWTRGWPLDVSEFRLLREISDALIINNQECWEKTGKATGTYLIPNGVDVEIFNVRVPPARRTAKALWVGSTRFRSVKGYDEIMCPVRDALVAEGVDCELLLVDSYGSSKRTPDEMAQWYNTGTVLVCASRSEGTPNPALEAAACGCTVVSTRVGNMPQLIQNERNGYLVDRDVEAILRGVKSANANYLRLAGQLQLDIRAWRWAVRAEEYFDVFRGILKVKATTHLPPAPAPRPDLSDAVTVFVSTVGAPTFASCVEHLAQQDCRFTLKIIDHVAPMSAAFQRMLDECRTSYFVQVDEDMLLYPHAVRTLYEWIVETGDDVAMYVGGLYDLHLERGIEGVKIFRHAIVRGYPFQDVESCEKVQARSMERDGFRILKATVEEATRNSPSTLGLHGTSWAPRSIFERYATLERKRRRHPDRLRWFERVPPLFVERFMQEPTELNFFALMGVIAGTLADTDGTGREKDYRRDEAPPGFESASRFFDEVRKGAAGDP